MATKVKKRSDRRKEANGEFEEQASEKQTTYEQSLASLKEGAWRWGLFFLCIILLWFIFKFQ